MNWRNGIKDLFLLAIVFLCLFGFILNRHSDIFRGFETALLSPQWLLLACITAWCGTLIFLTFSMNDLPLIGLLLIAVAMYFISYVESSSATDAIMLLAGVTLGKSAFALLRGDKGRNDAACFIRRSSLVTFLVGLVVLLVFSSWWHLNLSNNYYHGPRWMGLWHNPNIYGILMGIGVVLSAGLIALSLKSEVRSLKPAELVAENKVGDSRSLSLRIFFFTAAFMMGTGLVFSYSRGAWAGTAIGLLYLAKSYGKFKLRFILAGIVVMAAILFFFWHDTPDNAPWYMKRMDFSRPSAQHRVSAWRGALQIMRDHPFGVGWNKVIEIYEEHYSPPKDGAAAITTNNYLMLGTQLGLPGLICFIAYITLRLKNLKPKIQNPTLENGAAIDAGRWALDSEDATQVACRAGTVALLVAFWFDGGLFTLATAPVFWMLLELGSVSNAQVE
jgi:hypothetical protein